MKGDWDERNDQGFVMKSREYSGSVVWFWKVLVVEDFDQGTLFNDDE